ncbi:response regulator transcription factor [Streptomyces chryseus]
MSEQLSTRQLDALGRGLTLPAPTAPGRTWQPRTTAELHLLREAQRLDGQRRLLLAQVTRLLGVRPGREALAERHRQVLVGVARGEGPEETGRRLFLSANTVRTHRRKALAALGARSSAHALGLAVAAGLITAQDIRTGGTP